MIQSEGYCSDVFTDVAMNSINDDIITIDALKLEEATTRLTPFLPEEKGFYIKPFYVKIESI
ncbi:hypothetical protein MWU65_04695 [Cellulophaga sp. F20128]|uniref:hypothetical protein n=1 Tax=Cellulophaga sp. F20128 TaxID=2926413 RepID=UPI001FF63F80|nr:hypothetical protein [Cellulophaga sp. F20128]MCK0156464.1 hypothetical protein [Cellulophaga sp. F20128]